MRVNTSPALVPKALEPPTPPKAPARPPPLPRWISTRQIRNSEVRTSRIFRIRVRIATVFILAVRRVTGWGMEGPRSGWAAAGDRAGRRQDAQELGRLEAGPADQGAIDVGAGQQV